MSRNKKERKKQESSEMSRRRFLKIGLAAAAGLALTYLGSHNFRRGGRWEFLAREIDISLPYGWKHAVDNYVPLEPEREFDKDDPELQELIGLKMPAVQEECARRGWKQVALLGTEQHYGRPEEASFAEPYKGYLESGIDYVHSKLSQLKRVPLEIIVLRRGQDFSDVVRGKGFVGQSLHSIQRVYVDNENTGEKFVVGLSKNRSGAITKIEYNEKLGEIEDYFVFFGTGNDAILAPISEALHLSLTKFTQRHFDRLGFKGSQTAEESLVEGISYIIGQGFIREIGIPGWEEKLKKMLQDMKKEPRYRFVPASIEWLRRNGIEQGLALYMEDPGKYLEAITR